MHLHNNKPLSEAMMTQLNDKNQSLSPNELIHESLTQVCIPLVLFENKSSKEWH